MNPGARPGNKSVLDVELEQHQIAVLGDVFLAFLAHLSRILAGLLAAQRNEIVIRDGLGANEATLKIGVNGPRRFRRLGAFSDRPGANLFGSLSEERDQVEKLVTGVDDPR